MKKSRVPLNWRRAQQTRIIYNEGYYEPKDLSCGTVVDIYGRFVPPFLSFLFFSFLFFSFLFCCIFLNFCIPLYSSTSPIIPLYPPYTFPLYPPSPFLYTPLTPFLYTYPILTLYLPYRYLLLVFCDRFTKEYYEQNMGYEQTSIPLIEEKIETIVHQVYRVYRGFIVGI